MSTKIIHPFHLIEESTFLNLSVSFETYFTKIFCCFIPFEIQELLKKLLGPLIFVLGTFVIFKILSHFLIIAMAGGKSSPIPKPHPDCFLQTKIAEVRELLSKGYY